MEDPLPNHTEREAMLAGERSRSYPAFTIHKHSTRSSPDASTKPDQVSDVGREVVVGVCAMNRKVCLDSLSAPEIYHETWPGARTTPSYLLSKHDVLSQDRSLHLVTRQG